MNCDKAQEWVDKANSEKQIQEIEPRWSCDCGLELDYDGGLLRVSSSFYQVSENKFDGSVSFCIGDVTIFRREFSSRHIDNLKKDVEAYVQFVSDNVQHLLTTNLLTFVETQIWY